MSVGDAREQANVADMGLKRVPRLTTYLSAKVLPVKVPVILDAVRNGGNDPEYLVGISAAASATAANRTTLAANPIALYISSSPCMYERMI